MADDVIIVSRERIEFARWLTVRAALGLEIKTGMARSSRGTSTRVLANRITGQDHRSKRAAYDALNLKITEVGGQDRPLS